MKSLFFVESLNIKEIRYEGQEYFRYEEIKDNLAYCSGLDISEIERKEHLVKVHDFFKLHNGATKVTHIAYSKEVQEALKIPFDALSKQLERLYRLKAQRNKRTNISSIC